MSHQETFIHKTEPQSSEPRQWIVVERQCVPIKQELEENASSILLQQENLVVKGLCVPIKQDLEGNATSI